MMARIHGQTNVVVPRALDRGVASLVARNLAPARRLQLNLPNHYTAGVSRILLLG